jgi:hypothetical protein
MSLGWGLRGSIGGGPLGAMIPGAMIGLALCLLLGHASDAGRIAAFAAIGVGFGGQETYGNTVGFVSHAPWHLATGYIGLAVKGFVWGLIGGAWAGVALHRDRYSLRAVAAACAVMIGGTTVGWAAINHPRLIYFSRDREEVWAGLLLGGVLLIVYAVYRGRTRTPLVWGAWWAIGGGIGFPLGAALMVAGAATGIRFDWWKVMELVLGLCLGVGMTFAARRWATVDAPVSAAQLNRQMSFWMGLGLCGIVIALYYFGMDSDFPFPYTLLGSALLLIAFWSGQMAWHICFTLVWAATAMSVARNGSAGMWVLAAVSTVPFAWWAAYRAENVRTAYLALVWGITALSHVRMLFTGVDLGVAVTFQVLVVVLTAVAFRGSLTDGGGSEWQWATTRGRLASGRSTSA